jgi:ATP-dependent helicase/nuclease subunit A
MKQPFLFDPMAPEEPERPPDQAARDFAADPGNNVVLEASAGTGKTRVLVDRYVRLIESGVDPRHILAMTFTRKAAAEMRDRVIAALRARAEQGALEPEVWRPLRDRLADVQISTIDAFCFGLLREFPLEADVDPAFEIADETAMARFANEALDLTMRSARDLMRRDERVRLLFARISLTALRQAIETLLDRRQSVVAAVRRFIRRRVRVGTSAEAAAAFIGRIREVVAEFPDVRALIEDGPSGSPEFRWLQENLANLDTFPADDPARVRQFRRRLERHFLTKDGKPRKILRSELKADVFRSNDARKRHEAAMRAIAGTIHGELQALDAHVVGLLAGALERLLHVAIDTYESLLDEHALLDFTGMLTKTVALLERQEEFARSRLKLQARYHHVLVDEFQDTSRLQWRLVELLIEAWGEGEGVADAPTSIFIVGDRKQSIYRFRHAEVTLLDEAARKIGALRERAAVRQAIKHSYRAVPELQAFVNALSSGLDGDPSLAERFVYRDADRFIVPATAAGARRDGEPVLGLIAEPSMELCAAAVAAELERLLRGNVRDRRTKELRPARRDDFAILFRARAGHQYFEEALEARGIRTYVYKGLGFFDAPEVQDLQTLMRYFAQPDSDLRAAELLRSRVIRLSDIGLTRLAPAFADALASSDFDPSRPGLEELDAALLARARKDVARWRSLADGLTPSEVVDTILRGAAYAFELGGRRLDQARENLKKLRALVRQVENRGYATLGRLADYFETLKAGEESNAIIEAANCVHLMTIHAAKGLEFPVVFLVNVHQAARGRAAISVVDQGPDGEPEVAFQTTEATRHEDKLETEELRRLLYVATTRACDRLYLAGEVDEAPKLRKGARSIGALLPDTLQALFGQAAATPAEELEWGSDHGAFAFRVCRPPASPVAATGARPAVPDDAIDYAPIGLEDRVQIAATDGDRAGQIPDGRDARRPFHQLVGSIVHRLFERRLDPLLDVSAVQQRVPDVVRADEWVDVVDAEELTRTAAELYCTLRSRDDVTQHLASGTCHFEVPFSFHPPDRPGELVRGVVDCLVVAPDGRATVLEFKTGAPRPEHLDQTAWYARAVEAALGCGPVALKILYPGPTG